MKGKNLQPRLLYLAKISLKINGEIKSFSTSKSEENSVPPNQLQNKCKRDLYSQEIQEKKKDLQNQPQTIKKMTIGTHISIITLNVNGLNASTKRYRLAECIQKQDPYICYLQKTHFRPKDIYRLKVRGWEIYSMQMESKRKAQWPSHIRQNRPKK